jgi:hypothetical protein
LAHEALPEILPDLICVALILIFFLILSIRKIDLSKKTVYMKIRLLILSFTVLSILASAQSTWQRAFTFGFGYAVDELSDGSFICAFDSMGNSYLLKLSATGQTLATFAPVIRTDGESIYGIAADPHGGYLVCGESPDTSGAANLNGFYARIDTAWNITDTIIYPAGTVSGSANCLRVGPDSNAVVSTYEYNGAGSGVTHAYQVVYPSGTGWNSPGIAGLSESSIEIDDQNRTLFTSYNATAADLAKVDLIDSTGNLLHTFSVTDTALGGTIVFASAVGLGTGNSYGFACNLSPFSLSNDVVYFTSLDTAFNINWSKVLNWGGNLRLISIIPAADSGFVLMMNMEDTIRIHKLSPSGDSVWTKSYSGFRHAYGLGMSGTDDGGLVIVGFTDSLPGNNSGYILRINADGDYIPVTLSAASSAFCQGDSVALMATPGLTDYQWSNGDTGSTTMVSQPGDYWVTVTDQLHMQYTSDTITLTQYAVTAPVITRTGDSLMSSQGVAYQWFDTTGIISGATSQTYSPPASGQYMVQVTDSNGCMAMSTAYNFIITGIEQAMEHGMKIIQQGKIVTVNSPSPIVQIEIVSLDGKLIWSGRQNNQTASINLSAVNNGIYFIVVSTSTFRERRQIRLME